MCVVGGGGRCFIIALQQMLLVINFQFKIPLCPCLSLEYLYAYEPMGIYEIKFCIHVNAGAHMRSCSLHISPGPIILSPVDSSSSNK